MKMADHGRKRLRIILTLCICLVPIAFVFLVTEESALASPRYKYPLKLSIPALRPREIKAVISHGSGCYPKFKKILLVIVFNYPLYDSVPMLRRYYELVFPNIVYCGPGENEQYGVLKVDTDKGYWGYECLGEAIRKNPGYEGYFYINDDSLINWWTVHSYDLNRVWSSIDDMKKNLGSDMAKAEPSNNWYWWKGVDAFKRCKIAFAEIESLSKKNGNSKSPSIDQEVLKIFFANTKGIKLCGESYSDVFYVPGKLSYRYSNISNIFFKHKVFLEASVPTILRFLDYEHTFQPLNGLYLRTIYGSIPFHDGIHFWEHYNTNVTFFHPIKLSKTRINRNLFSDIVYNLGVEKLKGCKENTKTTSGAF